MKRLTLATAFMTAPDARLALFLNATPLIVNAAIKFVPRIKPRSLEARTFLDVFESVLPAGTHSYEDNKISVFLPA